MARTFLRFCRPFHHIPRTRRLLAASALLLGLALAANPHAYAQFPKEKPTDYVSDLAGVLSPAARQQLENLCKELDEKTKAQLAIVTVKSLEGRPLEEFTIDLATKWGIGPKGSDRGVMLFLAIQDRRSRIEVGYGLEPIIPDGKAGEILRSMTPYLRNGDYGGALRLGASTIAQIIAQDAGVTLAFSPVVRPARPIAPRTASQGGLRPGDSLVVVIAMFVLTIFLAFDRSCLSVLLILLVWGLGASFDGFPVFWALMLLLIACVPGFLTSAGRKWTLFGSDLKWKWLTEGGNGSGGSWGGGGGGFGGFGGGSFGGGGASGSW